MLATVLNCTLIVIGSLMGILLRNRISARFTAIIIQGLSLCVIIIGLSSALGTNDTLCLIICMVLGTILGEALNIEDRLDDFGIFLRKKLVRGKAGEGGQFTEGFVTASILFCVGAMAVMGSIDAGINNDYSFLISKSVIDGVSSITFAAAMGVGVLCSFIPVLIYQGSLTLLASLVAPYLTSAMVTEMSAVGGLIIVGIGFNMLAITDKNLKVGNMLPAIFSIALPPNFRPDTELFPALFLTYLCKILVWQLIFCAKQKTLFLV